MRIAVFGDIMLDIFQDGTVGRVSPEAPVPVVLNPTKTKYLGGAGNLALNLKRLGHDVTLFTDIGSDRPGEILIEMLKEENIECYADYQGKPTTVKERIKGNDQHIVRVDTEDTTPNPKPYHPKLMSTYDAVVISHYRKGFITEKFAQWIIKQHRPTFVDTPVSDMGWFLGATVVKTNEMTNTDLGKNTALVVTRGKEGAILLDNDDDSPEHFPHVGPPVNEVDVTGAGDVFVAALVHRYFSNENNIREAITFANMVAGMAVTNPGTSTIPDMKRKL